MSHSCRGERKYLGCCMTRKPTVPLIVVPDEACGPAMAACSPPQRAFVICKVAFGCTNAEAARRAGYQSRDRKTSYRVAHDPRVQAALLEEGLKLMRSEGPRSILTLVSIRDNKRNAVKDRLKAAAELLNRSGFHALT